MPSSKIPLKRYAGYNSFDYLRLGTDYESFKLADKLNRVPAYDMELTDEQEETFARLFTNNLVVSLRDHGFIVPEKEADILPYCRQLHTFYHYEGLAHSGIDVIFENFMDGISLTESKTGLKWAEVISLLGMRYADISKQDTVYLAANYDDLVQAKKREQIALLPSLEAANILENEVDRVDILYGLGIRCMGLTYNEANTLGSGLVESPTAGLTRFGERVVERMNRIGMLIDLSHCNEQTSLDAIAKSTDPIFITHAGAKGVWNSSRMKSDQLLQACAEKGGVIGICAAPNTTLSPTESEHNLDAIMEHVEYIVNLVGIDHVGLGPDTFFGDHRAIQRVFDNYLSLSDSHEHEAGDYETSEYVIGAENPVEAMSNMTKWLIKHGYKESDIEKVISGNALRVMRDVLE